MADSIEGISFTYNQPDNSSPSAEASGCLSSINCTSTVATTNTTITGSSADNCASPIHFDATCENIVRHRSSMIIFLLCFAWILTVVYACYTSKNNQREELQTNHDESSSGGARIDPKKRQEEIQKVINIKTYTSPNTSKTSPPETPNDVENSNMVIIQVEVEEDGGNSAVSCNICLESLQDGDEIASAKNNCCHHEYHVECLSSWLAKHDGCPMCRKSYFEDEDAEPKRSREDDEQSGAAAESVS